MKKSLCCIATISATVEEFMIPAMELFIKDGYEVTLICNMTPEFKEKYSATYKCIDVKMKRAISIHDIVCMPFVFYKIFKTGNYDYVQYATTLASLYASVAAWAAKVPCRVRCLWGIAFYTKKGVIKYITKWVEKLSCIFSTHISVASRRNQKIGADSGLFKLKHSSVIGDGGTVGVDLKKFDIAKREDFKRQVLQEFSYLSGKTVYGYLGRIYRDKGVNELLEAYLSIRNKDTALLLIGAFESAQTPIDSELLNRAKTCKDIVFMGVTTDVPKYLSVVDILVHPTYHEGFSMAIQQAMAMGCAIVTTDVPGPSEVIENGVSGITVPARNTTALTIAMLQVLDKDTRNRFVSNALERVNQKFTRERMVKLTYQNRIEIMKCAYR